MVGLSGIVVRLSSRGGSRLSMLVPMSVCVGGRVRIRYFPTDLKYHVCLMIYGCLLTNSLCQTHKTESNQRHPFLSAAIPSTSCVFIFCICVSLAMVHWYIPFERPLFPDGFPYHACFGVLVVSIFLSISLT